MNSSLLQLPNTFRTFYGAFSGLYPIQEQAIRPILANRDLIIQSATGSGKTEAVLAPCLERIISSGLAESAIYIVPTRALAFDIQRRFASVLRERLGIHFAIRTGDIKRSGGGRPDIMLTTPESLDVMLGSSNVDLRGFLRRVRTVIIDEVHPLIHHYRGRQLTYLLHRLERRIGRSLQKIALSATIADPVVVGRFLHLRPDFVLLTESVSRKILPRLLQLKNDESELVNLLADLSREWQYRKILIFANSRGRCDKIFSVLNHQGVFKGMAELHYSNLNVRERQAVEKRFRRCPRSVCIATSTLELGIDVGDVDAVILFEPPDSVSAFLQRIGRSNRRQDTIHFWGICRGERASEQLLRFLALLHLAREGRVESSLSKMLPSVLSQQLVSCLYEKKRLSLKALQELFSGPTAGADVADLQDIFNSLRRKRWLKETAVPGLYAGGWFYWDALVEHQIWSNFPESEQDYSLEVLGESVADIPQSIVKQFDPGDHVLLAGRRLHILSIDEGKRKRVVAEPSERLDAKELSWLGMGIHVSYEVAQAMRAVLKSTRAEDNVAAPGLFSRTRMFIRQELEKDKRVVMLANGIEVLRTANGSYYYRTFIGAVGNLVLAWSIREAYAEQEEDFQVAADEIGLSCFRLIDFRQLSLPLTDEDFNLWLERHFKVLRVMFPLNSFCSTLPKELLLRELAGFIRDPRLIDFFKRCQNQSSEIVQGDPENLDVWPQPVDNEQPLLDIPAKGEPLLAWEKKRRAGRVIPVCDFDADYQLRALTGSIIGGYFRHHQCRRWFCFHFLPSAAQPLCNRPQGEDDLAARKQTILDYLSSQHKIFSIIAEKDENGRTKSLKDRFAETVSQLQRLTDEQDATAGKYIYRPVLLADDILSPSSAFFNSHDSHDKQKISLPGVGVPGLIRIVAGEEEEIVLQVGDIKSSRQPQYYQKWQVAFYAFLLRGLVQHDRRFLRLKVADSGFLFNPSPLDDFPRRHTFALQPYFASVKTIFANLQASLCASPNQAGWQLQKHCVSCSYFEFCYEQALREEEVQFIPRLPSGLLRKMRSRGLATFNSDADFHQSFSPAQRGYLQGAISALDQHKITILKKKTSRFPANISTSFFVYLVNDPLTALPQGVGLGFLERGKDLEIMTWTVCGDRDEIQDGSEGERRRIWREFSSFFLGLWQAAVQDGRGPHIFLFGNETRQGISTWAALMEDAPLSAIFRPGIDAYCTDLQDVFFDHFLFPLPGVMTLFALNRLLGLLAETEIDIPESLFHGDRRMEMAPGAGENDVSSGYRDRIKSHLTSTCRLIMKLEQWIGENLESEWQRDDWRIIHPDDLDRSTACRQFIEAEKIQQERELRSLQELSLAERVERFRALGPLRFTGTTLDDEGRFLYLFSLVDRQ
ncbi:MAG: DEAD/DEAH box helicase, partial [Pseudomonadota bacterium]|nr:DEAD/DEAH box helicase [Pseudomonadota bacterium]